MISEDIINTFNEIVSEFLLQMNNSSINRINMRCFSIFGNTNSNESVGI